MDFAHNQAKESVVQASTLGALLRRRRRQLELTQQDIAAKVGVRSNYIGYLERDMRRPSPAVLAKIAKALDLDRQELFFLANPQARQFISDGPTEAAKSAWEEFRNNKRLHTRHGVSSKEIKALEAVSKLGSVQDARDYLFILQVIRQALLAS